MKTLSTTLLGTLFLLTSCIQQPQPVGPAASSSSHSPPREYFFFVAEGLPESVVSDCRKQIQVLVAEKAQAGDILHFFKAPYPAEIGTLTVPNGNPRTRLRKRDVAATIAALADYFHSASLVQNSTPQLQVPELLDTISTRRAPDRVTVVLLVGDPLFQSIHLDQRAWSMKCRRCSAVARPNILMFGDWAWLDHRTRAQQQRFMLWLVSLEESGAKFAVVELGAGTAIPTVRLTSERLAEKLRGTLVRINLREATVPDHAIGLPLGALEGVQRLYAAV